MCDQTAAFEPQAALRAFRKIVFLFLCTVLQSVEILLSGTVVRDRFTHRPWPSRVPLFWGPAQLLPMATHYQGRSQDFSKGGAEVMEAKALKKKNCL